MFSFRKKKEVDQRIVAPVSGRCIALSSVQDPMFAQGVLGVGVAFQYEQDTLYAPCEGEVIVLAATKHAIGIKSTSGIELLLHIGFDSVNLNGTGFTTFVKLHDHVTIGTPLIRIDRSIMKEHNIDLTTPMVVTNHTQLPVIIKQVNTQVTQGIDELIQIKGEELV